MIDDLRTSVRNQPDSDVQASLQTALAQLENLL
jgi:hypothetical protein